MTTILAIETKEGYTIGADGLTSGGGGGYTGDGMEKIVKNGAFYLAAGGRGDICDAVQSVWRTPAVNTTVDVTFMRKKFIPSLRGFLKDIREKDHFEDLHLIVGVQGRLFSIEGDATVLTKRNGIYGIGSGSPYGVGAIHAGATIEEALKIACDNDLYSSLPFLIITQSRGRKADTRKEVH